jgi:hypothetical protein
MRYTLMLRYHFCIKYCISGHSINGTDNYKTDGSDNYFRGLLTSDFGLFQDLSEPIHILMNQQDFLPQLSRFASLLLSLL